MDLTKAGFKDILSKTPGTGDLRTETFCVEYYLAPEAVRSESQVYFATTP
jgi:hypothetical protein